MTDDLEKMPSGGARKLSPVGLVIAIGMIFMALAFTACGGSDDSGSDAGGTGAMRRPATPAEVATALTRAILPTQAIAAIRVATPTLTAAAKARPIKTR